MSVDLSIRSANREDCPQVLSLIKELAEFEKLSHEVVATVEDLERSLFTENRGTEVWIAEANGEVVGFALFFSTYSTFLGRHGLYLEDLFIKPKFRNRGYGEIVLRKLARLACDRGYGRFEWSVLDWNEHALRFYRRLGARPMSDWTVQRVDGDALRALAKAL